MKVHTFLMLSGEYKDIIHNLRGKAVIDNSFPFILPYSIGKKELKAGNEGFDYAKLLDEEAE